MRKLKGSSNHVKSQSRIIMAKAITSITLTIIILFFLSFRVLLTLQIGILEAAIFVASLILLTVFYYHLHKYHIYKGGWEGEKSVIKLLNAKLNNDYYLINSVHFRKGGDIDHIVLAPSGIFVLETKNWSGKITCHDDEWQRADKGKFTGNPSLQVKKNTEKIKRILANASVTVNVEGIIVFTNKHAYLNLYRPTVTILKVQQLPNYIMSRQNNKKINSKYLEFIGKEIIKQAS